MIFLTYGPLTFWFSADVDLSFDGWGQDGIREVANEQALSVEDLIELADSCAKQLHGEQELLILHASLSHGEEHACSLDGSGCGPEMPEPASQACRLQVPRCLALTFSLEGAILLHCNFHAHGLCEDTVQAQHVSYTSKGSNGGMHREFQQNVFGTPAGEHLYVKWVTLNQYVFFTLEDLALKSNIKHVYHDCRI